MQIYVKPLIQRYQYIATNSKNTERQTDMLQQSWTVNLDWHGCVGALGMKLPDLMIKKHLLVLESFRSTCNKHIAKEWHNLPTGQMKCQIAGLTNWSVVINKNNNNNNIDTSRSSLCYRKKINNNNNNNLIKYNNNNNNLIKYLSLFNLLALCWGGGRWSRRGKGGGGGGGGSVHTHIYESMCSFTSVCVFLVTFLFYCMFYHA